MKRRTFVAGTIAALASIFGRSPKMEAAMYPENNPKGLPVVKFDGYLRIENEKELAQYALSDPSCKKLWSDSVCRRSNCWECLVWVDRLCQSDNVVWKGESAVAIEIDEGQVVYTELYHTNESTIIPVVDGSDVNQ